VGDRKNLEQMEDKRKRQVFGKMKRVHSRIRYLGRKEKLEEHERSNQRV